MRGWGIAFIGCAVGAVGAVALPGPLKVWPLVLTILAGIITLAAEYPAYRERIQAVQDADTAKSMAYLGQIRSMDDDVEAEWAALVDATEPRPLGPRPGPVEPDRPRTVKPRLPQQRIPGGAS